MSMHNICSRAGVLPGLALALLLSGAGPARAAGSLNLELAEVAKDISKLLEGREEDSIAVGQFTGPSRMPSSAGPAIMKALSDELEKLGVPVKSRAGLEVKGDYLDVEDKTTKQLAALLKARVIDRSGNVVVEFNRGVFGDATLASLFGLTTELPANGDQAERDEKLRKSIDEPKSFIKSSRIAASDSSPYAVEILVKAGEPYGPRAATDDDGLAFVEIKRSEVYAVRLINDSPHDAAVTLTIDGLNMFSFSKNKEYHQVIVSAKSSGTIQGWHVTNEVSDSFLVTEYAKSAAGELKSTNKIGTITASFAAAWPVGSTPPSDEPAKPPSEFSRSGDATGRGPQVAAKYTEVQREFGVTRATVSVRYTKTPPADLPK